MAISITVQPTLHISAELNKFKHISAVMIDSPKDKQTDLCHSAHSYFQRTSISVASIGNDHI